jgi:hypothetical protein
MREMKRMAVILMLAVMTSGVASARQEETLDQLKARADAARPEQQPDLCTQVADRELKLGLDAFKDNKFEEGHAAFREMVNYSGKAQAAASSTGKHIKHTEIKIRQLSTRLRDLKMNVGADDQPAIQNAVDKLEEFRTALLQSMFGSKDK